MAWLRPKRLVAALMLSAGLWSASAWPAEPARPSGLEPASSDKVFSIRVRGDRLSVRLRGVRLAEALEEIGRQGNIRIVLVGVTDQKVTVAFTNLPLATGLRRIIRHDNVAFVYLTDPATPGGSRLGEVQVYARGQPQAPAEVTAAPVKQRAIIEERVSKDTERATQLVGDAVNDQRNSVREDATNALRAVDQVSRRRVRPGLNEIQEALTEGSLVDSPK